MITLRGVDNEDVEEDKEIILTFSGHAQDSVDDNFKITPAT